MLRALVAFALATLGAAAASAQDGDGVYGRLDTFAIFSVAAGGGVALGDAAGEPRGLATLEARFRMLDSAGLVLAGELRPDASSRVLLAADLRPVFLLRFLLGNESGDAWLDLLVDSLGLELGVAVVPLERGTGVGLALGAGLEIPIWLPARTSEGVFVRLAVRHVRSDARDEHGSREGTSDTTFYAALGFRLGAPSAARAE